MSSVLATRKVAGEGNYFVVLGDASGANPTAAAGVPATIEALTTFAAAGNFANTYAAGTLLKDLGKRKTFADGDRVQVLAKVISVAAQNNGSAQYVCIRDDSRAGDTVVAVEVASVGPAVRN